MNSIVPFLSGEKVEQMHRDLAGLPTDQIEAMVRRHEWLLSARHDQIRPDDCFAWVLLGGRGSGKTRAGTEHFWWEGYENEQRIAIVAPTNNDVKKTCFEGESGLLARIPESLILNYNRTDRELWTRTMNGGKTYYVGYSAEEPERLRGPQHHRAWCEELATWNKAVETWDNLMFGLRLGSRPNVTITTTPRPPNKRKADDGSHLLIQITKDDDTSITSASTFDNADNLPASTLKKYREKYEGTRIGRQELYAEILLDVPGALWTPEMFEYVDEKDLPQMKRMVVGVDPSGSTNNDDVGIAVAGLGVDEVYYVFADCSINGSPGTWARATCDAYDDYEADRVVAETNYGGKMVESNIRTVEPLIPYRGVHATRGKVVRAEPIAALYEQKKVKHVRGPNQKSREHQLDKLEDQLCKFTPSGYGGQGSPDRADACIWALSDLKSKRKAKDVELAVMGGKREEE